MVVASLAKEVCDCILDSFIVNFSKLRNKEGDEFFEDTLGEWVDVFSFNIQKERKEKKREKWKVKHWLLRRRVSSKRSVLACITCSIAKMMR
jgi:hypothetical protein